MLRQVDLVSKPSIVALELERESSHSDFKRLVTLVVNPVLMVIVVGTNASGKPE